MSCQSRENEWLLWRLIFPSNTLSYLPSQNTTRSRFLSLSFPPIVRSPALRRAGLGNSISSPLACFGREVDWWHLSTSWARRDFRRVVVEELMGTFVRCSVQIVSILVRNFLFDSNPQERWFNLSLLWASAYNWRRLRFLKPPLKWTEWEIFYYYYYYYY